MPNKETFLFNSSPLQNLRLHDFRGCQLHDRGAEYQALVLLFINSGVQFCFRCAFLGNLPNLSQISNSLSQKCAVINDGNKKPQTLLYRRCQLYLIQKTAMKFQKSVLQFFRQTWIKNSRIKISEKSLRLIRKY